jgi:hypothetical protein
VFGKVWRGSLDNTLLAPMQPDLALETRQRVTPAALIRKGKRGEAEEVVPLLLNHLDREPTPLPQEAQAACRNGSVGSPSTRWRPAGRKEMLR